MALEAAKGEGRFTEKEEEGCDSYLHRERPAFTTKNQTVFSFLKNRIFTKGRCMVAITFFRLFAIGYCLANPARFVYTAMLHEYQGGGGSPPPSHIHFETSLRSLSSRKRKRKGIVFASSFVKKNRGQIAISPPFPCKKCW